MADKIMAEFGGKSKYEIAEIMATKMLTIIEQKNLKDITRYDYLKAVEQAYSVLSGSNAPTAR